MSVHSSADALALGFARKVLTIVCVLNDQRVSLCSMIAALHSYCVYAKSVFINVCCFANSDNFCQSLAGFCQKPKW